VIFTILHILNPSRRHIDALLVDIDEDPSAGAAPPARLAAQRSAHGSGPDWPPETGTDASTKAYDTAANRNRFARNCCYER
jgi:hypothetical protein